MEVKISYDEISRYVAEHYNQTVAFEKVADHAFKVSYKISMMGGLFEKIPFLGNATSVTVNILDVLEHQVIVGLSSTLGFNVIVSMIVGFVDKHFPDYSCGLSAGPNHSLVVDLKKVSKLRALTENASLKSLRVEETGIAATLSLK